MSSSTARPRLTGRAAHAEHQAAVARRLDLLRAQLAAPTGAGSDEPEAADGLEDLAEPGPPGRGHGVQAREDWWADATRVRPALRPDDLDLVDPPPQPGSPAPPVPWSGVVPVPGRHAARRRRALATELVPEPLRGRFALGATQLTVVAVVVAVGLAVTAWTVVRSRPEPVAATAAAAAPVAGESGAPDSGALVELAPAAASGGDPGAAAGVAPVVEAAATGTSATGQGEVTVDVAGKVRRPGIAVLDAGARVVDAIEAAGGARPGVDLTALNLARPLVDGEQVLVGVDPVPGVTAAVVGAAPTSPVDGAATALVDLNAATEAQLDTLPEVGPVTAQSIIAWRDQHGGFSAVDELLEVDGIGESTLARIAPHVTV